MSTPEKYSVRIAWGSDATREEMGAEEEQLDQAADAEQRRMDE